MASPGSRRRCWSGWRERVGSSTVRAYVKPNRRRKGRKEAQRTQRKPQVAISCARVQIVTGLHAEMSQRSSLPCEAGGGWGGGGQFALNLLEINPLIHR